MARKIINSRSKSFINYHYNYKLPNKAKVKVINGKDQDLVSRYNDTTIKIQEIIQEASNQNLRLRPFGSRWSLSEVPYGKDWMLDNRSMNIIFDIKATDLHVNNAEPASNFLFVQSGNYIKELSIHLRNKKKSLKTSGASNGQTIAGAISTGVHGSALDVGSVQDFVVGLHLIVSPSKTVYLERASRPILNDNLPQALNAEIIRDDDLFNAALVGLGAFGFIHGVTIEAENRYLLERHIMKIPRNDALELVTKQNFETKDFGLPKGKKRPYHYKLYLNPYRPFDDFTAEILYKVPYRDHPSPIPNIKNSYYRDLPSLISLLSSSVNDSVPQLIKLFSSQIFPKENTIVKGTLEEIFYDTGASGAVFGSAIAVDIADAEHALNAMNTIITSGNKVPGILSLRFVKGTDATLGFTRFPNTAIVEVDGVKWKQQEAFLQLLTNSFKNGPFDFTFHWGKNADWSSGLVDRMYGHRKTEWKAQRDRLIKGKMKSVFTSKFLKDCGL